MKKYAQFELRYTTLSITMDIVFGSILVGTVEPVPLKSNSLGEITVQKYAVKLARYPWTRSFRSLKNAKKFIARKLGGWK